MWLKTLFIISICCAVSLSIDTRAMADLDVNEVSQPESLWPDTITLEWETLNIDYDQRRLAGDAMRRSQNSLTRKLLGNIPPASLTTFAPKTTTNPMLRRSLEQILAGQRNGPPILVQPVWTSLQGHQIFMLVVSESHSNVILRTLHHVITKDAWQAVVRSKDFTTTLTAVLDKMSGELLADPKLLAAREPDLAIGLHSTVVSGRGNEMERNALNLIFAAAYMDSYTITNPLSLESIAMIHRAWNAEGLVTRSNRNLSISWVYPESTRQQTLPLTLKLTIKPTEGVFSQSLPWIFIDTPKLTIVNDNQLNITSESLSSETSFKPLRDRLATERKALTRSEKPMVASIYGAWVYLDKGRAWGLKMNDRLVIASGSSKIKGHIVGYYGSEMKFLSPRGFPIAEGAIMFVRKGQHDVKVGNEFAYDQMVVPTAWPPKSSADR